MTDRLPAAIERRIPGLTSDGDSPSTTSFLRGLAMGALVGAAIAGSALLQRRRANDIARQLASESGGETGPVAADAVETAPTR